MDLLETAHHRPAGSPPTRRGPPVWSRLIILVGLVLAPIAVWNERRPSTGRSDPMVSPVPPPAAAAWWAGRHVPTDGRPNPQLELAGVLSGRPGVLELAFDAGFDVRLPVVWASSSGDDVMFAVENPHQPRRTGEYVWYVLHKTGARTSTLYRLKFRADRPTSGMWIPTRLDEQHDKVAEWTKSPVPPAPPIEP
jgi:hypothetical protein